MTDKPVAIVLPSWDPNEPRFIVEDCPKCSDDRQFKNGKCVYNQRLGFCYSVEEIVEVLNNTTEDEIKKLEKEINHLKYKLGDQQENLEIHGCEIATNFIKKIDEKINDVQKRKGYLFTSYEAEAAQTVLKELLEEIKQ